MIDLSDVCRNSSFDQWFSVFFIIHLANLRSVKIVQKSLKSQLLTSGNPVNCYKRKSEITVRVDVINNTPLIKFKEGSRFK